MKKVKKISIVSFSVVFLVAFIMAICIILLQYNNAIVAQAEMQIYQDSHRYDSELKNLTHLPKIDDDFKDDEITVILDCEHSGTRMKNSFYDFDKVVAELDNVDNIDVHSIKELFSLDDEESVTDTYRRMLSLKLEVPGKDNIIEAIEQLHRLDMVLTAEPHYNYSIIENSIPSDSYYRSQWALNGVYGINVEPAWDISTGAGVQVGLFEDGLQYEHKDLGGRVHLGNVNTSPSTDLRHGTEVAGIIAAETNNEMGIAGIAQAELFLLERSNFELSLDYAASNGIKIINVSFVYVKSPSDSSPAPADSSHRQAIENYGNKGGLLICGSGNNGANTDEIPIYPAGYGDSRLFPNVKNVISVGAINKNGLKSSISNYGENSVHIYAPGENVYTTAVGNGYITKNGTSIAAPHVTGAAALLLSYDQSLTGEQIRNIILNNAEEDIVVFGKKAKRLNIGKAMMSIFDSDRIGLQNMGYFSEGGGCNGSFKSGWNIQLRNYQTENMYVMYNKTMCYEHDAKNWSGLTDIDFIEIPAGDSKIVEIGLNGEANCVAFSFVSGNIRHITYADGLNSNFKSLVPHMTRVGVRAYEHHGIKVNLLGKKGGTWLVDLTNNTGEDRIFEYNSRMCFDGDAKNWSGLSHIKTVNIKKGSSCFIEITEYLMATSIAISYEDGSAGRCIFYAFNLNTNGTMTSYGTFKAMHYYSHNGMKVAIREKIGSTWLIELTNNTGKPQNFEYNSRMCFEGDAQNWTGLSHVNKRFLQNGESTVEPIYISEYGTATSITISYMDGIYRKIFYANNLNATTCTMTANGNTKDTTVQDSCLAAGTLITLADGSQKAVEELTGNEMLLVWNMKTGTYDTAPIMFIDSDPIHTNDIINLHFSDETTVKVIYEHGFWDFDLNSYVYLDENAEEYVGHWFNKQTTDAAGNYTWEKVQLTEVTFTQEYTTAWSPVTYGHLCYFVNGMLSMPGGIDGLFNIFEVDSETLTYNTEAMNADIEEYGLFTYEEFYEMYPISEEVFDAFNGEYLKVAIGKGLITYERIGELIERYAEFF